MRRLQKLPVNRFLCGDALRLLRRFPNDCIQTCITSPPYWLQRDYGVEGQLGLERSPQEFVAKLVKVFREVRRVLRPDGSCWINIGDSYASGKSTCHNVGGNDSSLQKKTKMAGAHPTTRLNLSDLKRCGLKPKDKALIPFRLALALQADGWWVRNDIVWYKANTVPESVRDRFTSAHEYVLFLAKSARYYWDIEGAKEPAVQTRRTNWQVAPRSAFLKGRVERDRTRYPVTPERRRRSVWSIPPDQGKDSHYATMPEKLVEIPIMASTRQGDIVLDPFMGSGTVAAVAYRTGRQFVGIDLNKEYVEISRERIDTLRNQTSLFASGQPVDNPREIGAQVGGQREDK